MSLKLGTTDISGVPTTLISTVNNKLDASTYTSNPRTNAVYITQTYHSGASWYRVWSDGFIEQGGFASNNTATDTFRVSLLKNMTTTTYQVNMRIHIGSVAGSSSNVNYTNLYRWGGVVHTRTTSDFTAQVLGADYYWYVCGY